MNITQLAEDCGVTATTAGLQQFVELIRFEAFKQCAAEGDILSELYAKPEYKSFSAKGAVYNYVNIIRNLPYNDRIT